MIYRKMKWIFSVNRQSVLPILLGISITTFGVSVAVLLYTMFEKDDNNKNKHSQITTTKRKEISVKVKILEKYVPAVIGKGGTVIKNIEELTNTRIKMERRNIYSSERVCYIQSNDMKNIHSAQNMIQAVIENLPVIETFYLFVPLEAFKEVFKKSLNGKFEFEHEIQKTYGVKLSVDYDIFKSETGMKRRIILSGIADQIASAVIHIEDKIQEVEAQAQLEMQCTAKSFSNNTDVKNTDDPDIETYEILIPRDAFKKIIGRRGYDIQEIIKSSGAKLIIGNFAVKLLETHESKNIITVKGTAAQVKLAISQIENKIQEIIGSPMELIIKRISESSKSTSQISISNNILRSTLVQDGLMQVFVTAMETPSLFWIQVCSPALIQLQNLVFEMTHYYNKEENQKFHILKKMMPGKMVAAKFKYDGKWYRAEIISVMESDGLCEVFFVDYGDMELVPTDDVLELRTDMLSLRHQAVECSLANVKPRENEWSPEASDKFAELTNLAKWVELTAKVKGYKERPIGCRGSRNRQSSLIPCIHLLYNNEFGSEVNIGDSLLQLKMAQVEEEDYSALNSVLSHDKSDLSFLPFVSDSYYLD
ncbi:tudor and KH domain-containing protein homolog isoform X2 [Monomorium pharaonis]|uniref:tudor and KH domain-containing protein homolog isoform X2 n=1 Tax=Monomorium pharaonis TaxID=307658 RepID=UPI00063F0F88|nr:tudor and KH domain-containing protein homolog isoform X2 [Monomorium pharaonis]